MRAMYFIHYIYIQNTSYKIRLKINIYKQIILCNIIRGKWTKSTIYKYACISYFGDNYYVYRICYC